jgi:hypothetical protein
MIKMEIKSVGGVVLFSHEAENNTIKETLERADLSGTDLSGADLSGTDLSGADLRGADLSGADLSGADLMRADLMRANLSGANLSGAILPQFCKWSHGIKDGKIRIGCKVKTIEDWDAFFNSEEEYDTPRSSSDFKQIRAIFESYKAYLNVLNSQS